MSSVPRKKGAALIVWFDLVVAVLASIGVIGIPGLLVAFVLGMRGLTLWALALPAGTTIVVMAALAAPFVGMSWGILPVGLMTVIIAIVAAVLRFALWRSSAPAFTGSPRGAIAAIAGACLIVIIQLVAVIHDPQNISQTFDNIFHLNAIRYALDTGAVSPLTIGSMTSGPSGGLPFYPSGWHAVASLVVHITGVTIPLASNAIMIFFAAVAWPLGVVFLVRTLFGPSTAMLVTAAAVSVALPAFPLLLIEYGVLFPYMMSLSLIAVPIALVFETCRRATWRERWPFIVGALGSLPGIAIAHPGGFVALLVFTSVLLGVVWVRLLFSTASRREKAMASLGAAGYIAAAVTFWYVLRPPAAARTWLPDETVGQAIGEVLTVSVWAAPMNLVVAVLVIVGGAVAVRRRTAADWTALGFLAAAAGLYIAVSGLQYLVPRDILTGAWYNNAPRLAALLPLAWVPLAAVGGARMWEVLGSWLARVTQPRLRTALAATVAVVTLVVIPQVGNIRQAVSSAGGAFAVTDASQLLTTDELALLDRLDDQVPEDAAILGSPWTGTALAYALADRNVVLPHTLMDITEDMSLVLDGLDTARPGSDVCDAVDRLGIEYVLDFGTQEVNGGEHSYQGMDRLSSSRAVAEVDAEGEAVLYEVVVCE